MKKALLLLTGGRMLPDLLFVKYMLKHWKPDVILAITTERGKKDTEKLQELLYSHFKCKIEVLGVINPSNEEEVKQRCTEALASQSDAEWVVHFTGAPKTVSLFIYDIVREHNIPYCFLDTDSGQVVSLVRNFEMDMKELYSATIEEYMLPYGRECKIHKGENYVKNAQKWYPIAELLANNYTQTKVLLQGLRKAQAEGHHLRPSISTKAKKIVQELQDYDFLSINKQDADEISCTLKDDDRRKFLHGDWLEVYVWQKVQEEGFADDCQWGRSINVDNELQKRICSNELDTCLTYNGKLLIAECKTSFDPLDSKYLDKLYAISNLIGKDYVRQVFITNHQPLKPKRATSFANQAALRNIKIITGEQLTEIGRLLKENIVEPNKNR